MVEKFAVRRGFLRDLRFSLVSLIPQSNCKYFLINISFIDGTHGRNLGNIKQIINFFEVSWNIGQENKHKLTLLLLVFKEIKLSVSTKWKL
jgi:hypothetical protein